MVDSKTLLKYLPPYKDSSVLIVDTQDTDDIMNELFECHSLYAGDYDRIYKFFDTGNIAIDARTLFDFCKKYIPYKVESEEDQTTRSPAAILTLGNGDCKHYAQFIGGIVSAIKRNTGAKFDWWYRYGNYDLFNDMPGHVFIVVKTNGNEYWIDPVLNRFNQRLEPNFYIDEKIPDTMLRRVSGINSQDVQSDSMQDLLRNPEVAAVLKHVDTSPPDVPYELADSINALMATGAMNAQGQVDLDLLNDLVVKGNSHITHAVFTIQDYIDQAATMGNFFDDAFKAVQHVAAGLGMQVPRAAFLGLVRLNAFHYADKLHIAEQFEDTNTKLLDLWWRVGGDLKALRSAIAAGAGKKPVISGMTIGCGCGGNCQGNAIGCAEAVSGAACLIASAAVIVAAIIPIITKLIAGKKVAAPVDTGIDPATGLPYGANISPVSKAIAWATQNPVIVIGGIIVIAYVLTDTKSKRA